MRNPGLILLFATVSAACGSSGAALEAADDASVPFDAGPDATPVPTNGGTLATTDGAAPTAGFCGDTFARLTVNGPPAGAVIVGPYLVVGEEYVSGRDSSAPVGVAVFKVGEAVPVRRLDEQVVLSSVHARESTPTIGGIASLVEVGGDLYWLISSPSDPTKFQIRTVRSSEVLTATPTTLSEFAFPAGESALLGPFRAPNFREGQGSLRVDGTDLVATLGAKPLAGQFTRWVEFRVPRVGGAVKSTPCTSWSCPGNKYIAPTAKFMYHVDFNGNLGAPYSLLATPVGNGFDMIVGHDADVHGATSLNVSGGCILLGNDIRQLVTHREL